jgi:hypothetical protein
MPAPRPVAIAILMDGDSEQELFLDLFGSFLRFHS